MSLRKKITRRAGVKVATSRTLKTKEDKVFNKLANKNYTELMYDKYMQQHIDNEISRQWNLK
jgi:hypothetical protein